MGDLFNVLILLFIENKGMMKFKLRSYEKLTSSNGENKKKNNSNNSNKQVHDRRVQVRYTKDAIVIQYL